MDLLELFEIQLPPEAHVIIALVCLLCGVAVMKVLGMVAAILMLPLQFSGAYLTNFAFHQAEILPHAKYLNEDGVIATIGASSIGALLAALLAFLICHIAHFVGDALSRRKRIGAGRGAPWVTG